MIMCKQESTLHLLKKDYDDFILLFLLSFFLILYFQKSLGRASFKSFVILSVFLILDMSCYQIGYIKALGLALIIGIHLENVYNLAHYYIIEYFYKRRKQISEILEREHIETDDELNIKDKPNQTDK